MSQPPQEDKPNYPLSYQTPVQGPKNSVGWFFIRLSIGFVAGVVACVLGLLLFRLTSLTSLFVAPPALVLAGAIYLAVGRKRYGYVTGVILVGPVLAIGLVLLILAICGSYR